VKEEEGKVWIENQQAFVPPPVAVPLPMPVTGEVVITHEVKPAPHKPGAPLPATTTEQEDLTKQGQRDINRIWELTQAIIAITLVMFTGLNVTINIWRGEFLEIPSVLSNALFVVLTFYFVRTNHNRTGGVGPKTSESSSSDYEGR